MKGFADDNLKFDENGRKFLNRVENIVRKGEIVRYEQFLLFYSVFKRLVLQTCKNQGLFWKGEKKNVCCQHFLLSPQHFLETNQ